MSENDEFRYLTQRALTLGSGCQFMFVRRQYQEDGEIKYRIIPVLMLTGLNKTNSDEESDGMRVTTQRANGKVGIVTTTLDSSNRLITTVEDGAVTINPTDSNNSDWLTLNHQTDRVVYPRIFIKSLQVKTNSDALVVKYQDATQIDANSTKIINYSNLKEYEDYSVLTRSLEQQYVVTLKPELVVKQGATGSIDGSLVPRQAIINYNISNADTSIYLDAIEVLKENAMPKVEYDVKPNVFSTKYCQQLYNKLGNIIRINDTDLKFKNIRGYISGLTLDLDNPDSDTIEVKNYKTKFEDLFSTITAQTEAMKKNSGLIESVAAAFTSSGELSQEVLQSSIRKVDLDYAFNNGKLTIDQHNGIWGTSDTGVVAFRGGGIFTATEKNTEGNWKWNTGITPEGINADLITTGQLDTNLIKIYSGDNLRFQMNGDGIFAYKNKMSHKKEYTDGEETESVTADESIDSMQYIRFCDDGLTLIAKKGAKVLNPKKNDYITVLDGKLTPELKRVELSWEGLILRNWQDEKVFFADADTGNLTLKGRIEASSGKIGAWNINNAKIWADSEVSDTQYTTFVALNAGAEYKLYRSTGEQYNISGEINTARYAFWAGSANPNTAPFSIQKTGVIKATQGTIGGWKMTPNFFYQDSSVVLAPGSLDGGEISISIQDDNGQKTNETNKLNLDGTILWAPGPSNLTTMEQSLKEAKFTVTKDGNLTAETVNGWIKKAFTVDKAPRIIISTSQNGISMRNLINGAVTYQNFNTLNSASDSWSIERSSGVTRAGSDSYGYKTATRNLQVNCTVTAGAQTKTFSKTISIRVQVHRVGSDKAGANAYYDNISLVSTDDLTIQ